MKNKAQAWIHANRVVLTNTSSLIGTTLSTSLLGFIYWWAAARLFPPEEVGFASAAVAAMNLLSILGMMGLGTLLIRELPRQPLNRGALISTAFFTTLIVSFILGVGFALFSPHLSPDFMPLVLSVVSIGLFAFGIAFNAVTTILDQAVIGLLRGGLQFWRNTLFASIKLVALVLVGFGIAAKTGMNIYTTWTIGNLLSMGYLAWLVWRERVSFSIFRPRWQVFDGLRLTALWHHTLNLTLQAPSFILPIIVTVMFSAGVNASFYIAWMIAGFAFVTPIALTTVLYAVGAGDPTRLAQRLRQSLKLSLLAGAAASIAVFIGADLILGLFGHSYADQATWTLRIIVLAVFPMIVRVHYIAINRIQGHIVTATKWMALGSAFELALAVIGGLLGGLTGLSIGWVAAVCLEAALTALPVYTAALGVEPRELHSVEPNFARR